MASGAESIARAQIVVSALRSRLFLRFLKQVSNVNHLFVAGAINAVDTNNLLHARQCVEFP